MKKIALVCLFSVILQNAFAQDLAYEVRGKYGRSVAKDVLEHSSLLSDIIADYPVNWVKDYVSVEVKAEKEGKGMASMGNALVLNEEQKSLLKKTELDSGLEINVWYKTINAVTEQVENNQMVVKMTVVPDREAEFEGGYLMLKKYLKENLVDRIAEKTPEEFQKGKVAFMVDSTGKLINIQISASSGSTEMDGFLLEVFGSMPNWKPAQNANGEKVNQQFEFSMGIGGC